jgi:hypothetical protein
MIYLWIYLGIGIMFAIPNTLKFVQATRPGGSMVPSTSPLSLGQRVAVALITFIMTTVIWPLGLFDKLVEIRKRKVQK